MTDRIRIASIVQEFEGGYLLTDQLAALVEVVEAAHADALTDDCLCREAHFVNPCLRCRAWLNLSRTLDRFDFAEPAA